MTKGLVYTLIGVGSAIGSYLPVIFGQSMLSAASILGGLVGAAAGIWAAVKIKDYF